MDHLPCSSNQQNGTAVTYSLVDLMHRLFTSHSASPLWKKSQDPSVFQTETVKRSVIKLCPRKAHTCALPSVSALKVKGQKSRSKCYWNHLVSWLRSKVGGTPVFGRRTDRVLRSACSRRVTTMWVNRPLQVSQLGQRSLSSFRGP